MTNQNDKSNTGKQGFASMDEDKQREIASQGGKAAHEKGTAHEFNHNEAVEAGHKGGRESHKGESKPASKASHEENDDSKQTSSKHELDNEKQATSKGLSGKQKSTSDTDDENREESDNREKSGKPGFASMDKDKQKATASKGGKH